MYTGSNYCPQGEVIRDPNPQQLLLASALTPGHSAGKLNPVICWGLHNSSTPPLAQAVGRNLRGVWNGLLFFLFLRGCEPLRGQGTSVPQPARRPLHPCQVSLHHHPVGLQPGGQHNTEAQTGTGLWSRGPSAWGISISIWCGASGPLGRRLCRRGVQPQGQAQQYGWQWGDRLVALSDQSRWPFLILFSSLTVEIPPRESPCAPTGTRQPPACGSPAHITFPSLTGQKALFPALL